MNFIEYLDGSDLQFTNGLIIKNPTVMDIKELDENVYNWYINLWTKKPQDMVLNLWEKGIDFETLTDDDFFIGEINNNKELFKIILTRLSNAKDIDIRYNKDMEMDTVYYKLDSSVYLEVMDFKIIDIIRSFYRLTHFYEESIIRKFVDYATKKYILDYELEEYNHDKKNSKEKDGYYWKIMALVVENNKRTWDYVYNSYVCQLLCEFNSAVRHENSSRLYTGLYSGNINYKEVSSQLNWLEDI